MTNISRAPLDDARTSLKTRAKELHQIGATKDQAYFMALEEAWRDEVMENARLWDQADEISALKDEILKLKRCLVNFAQPTIAAAPGSGLDTIGIYVRRGAVRDALALVGDVTARVILTERDETSDLGVLPK